MVPDLSGRAQHGVARYRGRPTLTAPCAVPEPRVCYASRP